LRVMCGCLKVSAKAYYAWLERKSVRKERSDLRETAVRIAVKEKFYFHKRRYGSKRLSDELKDSGIEAGRYLTRRIMREEGLVARQPRRFRPQTTDSRGTGPSPNLLKELENTELGAGEVLVGDITYLAMTNSRFCYLAMFQDVRTKRVAGWAVSTRMTAELVTDALRMALRRGHVKRNAIIHTDRGSQYASNLFRQMLERCRLRQSMSGKGNCYDNAQAESFFSRLKTEADMRIFDSVEEARSEAFDYIDCYYNRVRRHSTIGTTIPKFEKKLKNAERCGNAAHVEAMENLKAGFPHLPQSLGKAQSGFPTFPQQQSQNIFNEEEKGEERDFFVN
jgi:putative transposase